MSAEPELTEWRIKDSIKKSGGLMLSSFRKLKRGPEEEQSIQTGDICSSVKNK